MGPLIGLYDKTNTSLVGTYDWGTIKAQTPTPALTIQVWNNKEGSEDVSDLKEPQIEVLDSNGLTADTDVPKDKWVQVNVPSVDGDETTWTPIGGTDVKQIRANNNVRTELIIKGTKNDGDPISYPENVSTINVRLEAPINSTPGEKTFKIRLTGYYT